MERAKLYLIFTVVFLAGFLFLVFSEGPDNAIDFDKKLFSFTDPNALDRIVMTSNGAEILFENTADGWYVNNEYKMDESLRMVFFRMLNEVEVRRPVAEKDQTAIRNQLEEKGTLASFYSGDDEIRSFYVDGSGQSKTYFSGKNDDQVFLMEIPGYNQNVSAIFNLTALQWKDRKLFETPWQSLSSLEIAYTDSEKPKVAIKYEEGFPIVENVENDKLDSAKLINYLDQFGYFETNEYINIGNFERFDSLSKTTPQAVISVVDIDPSRSNELTIYPQLSNSVVRLVQEKNGSWSVIEKDRIERLLVSPNYFLRR